MTRRERVLGFCVGGTLGGLALVMVVQWAVLEPFKAVKNQITLEQARHQRLTLKLKEYNHVEADWKGYTARTFSIDPGEAEQRFRFNMHRLLERHGLRDPKVSPGSPAKYKDGSVGVPLNINATGTLNQIVGFLCDFYRFESLARIDNVRITADQSVIGNYNSARGRAAAGPPRPGRPGQPVSNPRAGDSGPNGPDLKVSISAVTLVLPKLKGIDHPVLPEPPEELATGRLQREREEYNDIFEKNPFKPYEPPITVVKATENPTPTPTPVTPTPVTPPPPSRPGAEQKFVRATDSFDGEGLALVYDERDRAKKPTTYRAGDTIDDENGKVLIVLPEGIVVQITQPDGSVVDYLYPLGKSYKDREVLDPEEWPEIGAALAQQGSGDN